MGVLHRGDVAGGVDDRDPGGVVATILEAPKAVEQDRSCGTGAGVADDAAHGDLRGTLGEPSGYVGPGVGDGVGVGGGVGGGGGGMEPISMVTLILVVCDVTPAGSTTLTVCVKLPKTPLRKIGEVVTESMPLSRSRGPVI